MSKTKSKSETAPQQKAGGDCPSEFCCASSDAPWDDARKLKIVRHDYCENEVIDPGVNFFVLTLEHIGAKPKFSCEGHPSDFYVLFHASYELAMKIHMQGFFRVELASLSHGRDWWFIRMGTDSKSEKDKQQTLRWAAAAWQKAFWHNDPNEESASERLALVCGKPPCISPPKIDRIRKLLARLEDRSTDLQSSD